LIFLREKHRAVVIGGGWSGLFALKYLLGEGLDAHLYESRAYIGGIWHYDESENVGGVYRTAHATSSKTFLHASDFPFPSSIGEFPSHEEVLDYLHSYANHFQLWPNIHLNSKITRVEPQWSIILNDGLKVIDCDYLVVCSGQHQIANDPRHSHPFDQFTGTFSHSISYKTPFHDQFINKRILVVGGGETGSDLAVELSATVAKRVYMSIREGQWFQSRILGQQPADVMYTMLTRIFGYYNNIFVRCWRRFFFVPMWGEGGTGIHEWKPNVTFLHGFINKSREVVDFVALNRVVPKRGIIKIDQQLITFDKEETPVEIDHILLSTGYQLLHPFFSHTDIHDLYKLVFASGTNGTLAFVGTARPVFGSIPALSELQARWAAAVFAGRCRLPTERVMARRRRAYWERHARLYPHDDKRLKQLVNLFEYTDVIGDELGVRVSVFYLFFRHPSAWYHVYCASPWSPFLFRIGRLSSDDEKLAYQRHLQCIPAKGQTFHRYNGVLVYGCMGLIIFLILLFISIPTLVLLYIFLK
jgi:dimethylaniline monooxygenase (N-oxide forming)